MSSLYQLTEAYAELLGRLEEQPEDAVYAELDALSEDIGDKAEAYARIIQGKEREADMYEAEIRRLQVLRARAAETADRLRGNLLDAMRRANADRIATSIGTWSLRVNPPGVRVLDETAIPPEYTIAQSPKVDRRAILATFRETGEIIPGVEITHGQRVEFR